MLKISSVPRVENATCSACPSKKPQLLTASAGPTSPRTALVCTEQTYMGSGQTVGGHVVPLETLEALREVARSFGVPVHMDGARLANAAVASGIAPEVWAATADSVSVCSPSPCPSPE